MRHTSSNGGFATTRRTFLGGVGAAGALIMAGGFPIGIARAQSGKSLSFALSSYPPSLHPFEYTGTASLTVKLLIFRGLLSYDTDGKIRPELAESWTQPTPTTYEFTLRENARFHDGSPVEAEDVKFSYETIGAEKSTAHLRVDFQNVSAIEVIEPRRIRITLTSPRATFLDLLANGYAVIVSRNSKAPNFVGAGPFEVAGIERGTSIQMKAFGGYYKAGHPKVQGIRFIAMPDESLRRAALESGDVDIIEYVPTQDFARFRDSAGTTLESVDGPFMYLTFNAQKGPFADARVRRAVAYAIDRDALNAAGFSGVGKPIYGLAIPPNPAYDPDAVKDRWSHDPDKAKALLKEAGVGGGLVTSLLATSQYSQHNDTALVVQQNLAEVGIMAELNLPDWGTRVTLGNRGQYEIAVQGTAGAYNDPDAMTAYIAGGQSASYTRSFGFENARIDELLQKGRSELDVAKRREIYAEVETLALQEVPILPLLWRPQAYGLTKKVSGFKALPGFLSFQTGLVLEDVELG
ncbi:hypothetical protein N825_13755 [Skermanella stibiiresistens SB22]|uniref:Solute-binding protein family 5 domain-containing protein n=1 Tax=Skermanella stibiiresistens SB22 TaxID=1385369 RepID=W9H3C8_9PROT|nr:ABC transporter substrate-binding protein [Skermanella stibiiresistens]EWY38268.1 hypothetical protein N825_13755 [Skermanella stibiiresistens SB22]